MFLAGCVAKSGMIIHENFQCCCSTLFCSYNYQLGKSFNLSPSSVIHSVYSVGVYHVTELVIRFRNFVAMFKLSSSVCANFEKVVKLTFNFLLQFQFSYVWITRVARSGFRFDRENGRRAATGRSPDRSRPRPGRSRIQSSGFLFNFFGSVFGSVSVLVFNLLIFARIK